MRGELQCLLPRHCLDRPIAVVSKDISHELHVLGVVLDDQYSLVRHRTSQAALGAALSRRTRSTSAARSNSLFLARKLICPFRRALSVRVIDFAVRITIG